MHTQHNITKWILVPCPCCNGRRKVINGQWLKNIRENAQMDQRAFGRETNTSGPYISDIERNRRDCPSDIFEAYLRLRAS
jgi:hypothetical protein